jgi:hypothetical protein
MSDQDRMHQMLALMSPSATKAEKAQASQRIAMSKGNVVPELDWQRFITLKGTGGAATRIVQGSDGWIYVGDVPAVSVRTEVPFITAGATLRVETAVSLDGPWRDVVLQTSEGNATYVLGAEPFGGSFVGSAVPLRQYLRWAVQPPAGDWIVCFRIGLASRRSLPPRPVSRSPTSARRSLRPALASCSTGRRSRARGRRPRTKSWHRSTRGLTSPERSTHTWKSRHST